MLFVCFGLGHIPRPEPTLSNTDTTSWRSMHNLATDRMHKLRQAILPLYITYQRWLGSRNHSGAYLSGRVSAETEELDPVVYLQDCTHFLRCEDVRPDLLPIKPSIAREGQKMCLQSFLPKDLSRWTLEPQSSKYTAIRYLSSVTTCLSRRQQHHASFLIYQ